MQAPRGVTCARIAKTAEEAIEALELQAIRTPATLQGNELRIRVRSVSLNFPELLIMQDKYQFKAKPPFVLCGEGAGVVTEVGSEVRRFRPGDRAFFFTGAYGAAAEEVVLTESSAMIGGVRHLPEALTFSQGAGLFLGAVTAYHALVHRGRLQAGEWLLITGAAGGMGLAAVQMGKALGARVIAAASSDEKLEACRAAGADAVVNYKAEGLKDAVGRITDGALCDVIYDPVGGDVFDQCVRCVAPRGNARLLVVGFTDGRIPSLPANMALIKGFDLVGVRSGAQLALQPELFPEMMDRINELVAQGKLTPYVGAEFPLERAREAFALMQQRRVLGKCCITFEDASASKL